MIGSHLKKSFCAVALCAVFSQADYQPITQQWVQYHRGPQKEEVHAVCQTTDKGYILTGSSCSYGAGMSDLMLLKTDSLGRAEWAKYFGGTNEDGGYAVKQCSDGGYIVAGYTRSAGAGEEDGIIIKTDASGTLTWSKYIGGAENDRALSLLQTSDGNYVIAGWTQSSGNGGEAFLTKLSGVGSTLWTKLYGNTEWDAFYSVTQATDGFILAGETHTADNALQACVIRTLDDGTVTWSKYFGGVQDETAYCARQTPSGEIIMVGRTLTSGAGGADGFLMKLTATGSTVWGTTKGGKCDDVIYSAELAADGGFLFSGNTASYGVGTLNAFIIKTNSNGVTQWESNLPAATNMGSAFQQTADGQFIMALTSPVEGNTDILLAKLAYTDPVPPGTDPVRGVLYQAFTCVDALSEIGFGGFKNPYWFLNKQDGVLQTNTPGGPAYVSRVYTPLFSASRDTGYVQVGMNVGFTSPEGINWTDNNKFQFTLCNSGNDHLYTVQFRPKRPSNVGLTYDLRLLRGRSTVVATAITNRVVACGPNAPKVTFSLKVKKDGMVTVGFDAADGLGMQTYISVPDGTHRSFSKLLLNYSTGTAGDGNNHIVIDNLGISEVRE